MKPLQHMHKFYLTSGWTNR